MNSTQVPPADLVTYAVMASLLAFGLSLCLVVILRGSAGRGLVTASWIFGLCTIFSSTARLFWH